MDTLLIGRVTKDPELSWSPGGAAVVNMVIAVDRPGEDAGVDLFSVVVFGKVAEAVAESMIKGYLVSVEGPLHVWVRDTEDCERRCQAVVNARAVALLEGPRNDSPGGDPVRARATPSPSYSVVPPRSSIAVPPWSVHQN